VLAKASLLSDDGDFATCRIHAVRLGATSDPNTAKSPTVKPSFGLQGPWDEISLIGLVSSTSNIGLSFRCGAGNDGLSASDIKLVAIKVNRLIGTDAG